MGFDCERFAESRKTKIQHCQRISRLNQILPSLNDVECQPIMDEVFNGLDMVFSCSTFSGTFVTNDESEMID